MHLGHSWPVSGPPLPADLEQALGSGGVPVSPQPLTSRVERPSPWEGPGRRATTTVASMQKDFGGSILSHLVSALSG